jgi:alpha-L-rhamnosidase
MNKRDFPSYGHWIGQGATVTWEQWGGDGSRNHPMFGGGLNWFYRTLAGVNTDENEPGYRHIIIRPQLPEKLDHVYYSNMTPYGKVVSEVKRSGNRLELNITIPVGSYATVYLPAANQTQAQATESEHLQFLRMEGGYALYRTGSGRYGFLGGV